MQEREVTGGQRAGWTGATRRIFLRQAGLFPRRSPSRSRYCTAQAQGSSLTARYAIDEARDRPAVAPVTGIWQRC